ncbi:MAG: trypsin-like peptidase domain-containing protein [Chloroflexota bacterium]
MKLSDRKYLGVFFIVLFSLMLAGCSLLPDIQVPQPASPSPGPPAATTPINPGWTAPAVGNPAPPLPDIASVVAKVRPSVVAINTEVVTPDIFGQPFTQQGAGSGWIIDPNGIIVTNNHVVEGARSVAVTMVDGRTFPADVIRTDRLTDLAVIEIKASDLPAATVGDSTALRVGDWLVALGNPLDLGISATSGIVSALGVSISEAPGQTLNDLVQTDAAINPGNSGGPLLNMSGEVIGINSVKIAQVGVEGVGYAISSHTALPIIEQLVQKGYVIRPWLGVVLRTVDPFLVMRQNLPVDQGVMITEVAPNSPASRAGLQAGDVIVGFADREITSADDLILAINASQIGQSVSITYWRSNGRLTATATLTESPPPS